MDINGDERKRGEAAADAQLTTKDAFQLAEDESSWVREQLVKNPALPLGVRRHMASVEQDSHILRELVRAADVSQQSTLWRCIVEAGNGEALETWSHRRKLCSFPGRRFPSLEATEEVTSTRGILMTPWYPHHCMCGGWHISSHPVDSRALVLG